MKYISFALITLWAIYMLVTNGDLKPSDNFLLWILSVSSIMYSVINFIVFCVEIQIKIKGGGQ